MRVGALAVREDGGPAVRQRRHVGDVHDLEGARDDTVVCVHLGRAYIGAVSIARMEETLRIVTVPALDVIPGLVHGFEQRRGEAYAESRDEGRARVAAALAPSGRLHLLRQVHGAAVRTAPWEGTPEADAGSPRPPATCSASRPRTACRCCSSIPSVARWARPTRAGAARSRGVARGGGGRDGRGGLAARATWSPRSARRSAPAATRSDRTSRKRSVRRARASSARGRADVRTSTCAPPTARSSSRRACATRRSTTSSTARSAAPGYLSYRRDGKGAGRMISFVGWRE